MSEENKFFINDFTQTEFKNYIESVIVKPDKSVWFNDGTKEIELIPKTPFEKAFITFMVAYCSGRYA